MSSLVPTYQVATLFKMAISSSKNSLTDCVNKHRTTCSICDIPYHMDKCSIMHSVKEYFNKLPPVFKNTILQMFDYRNDLKYIAYYWLLEHPELQIKLQFRDDSRMKFLVKFSSYVRTLDLKYRWDKDINASSDYWSTIFYCASNLQNLDLAETCITVNLLENIGRECVQLKKIYGVEIPEDFATMDFKKLCFRECQNVKIRNPLCDTLQEFHFSDYYGKTEQVTYEAALILIQNIPNLRNLGQFHVDDYLRSENDPICKTNLETVQIESGTEYTLSLLQKYCPKLNILRVRHDFSKSFEKLHDFFHDLEELHVLQHRSNNDLQVYKIITMSEWSNLKVLEIYFSNLTIELSYLAASLPEIKTLKLKSNFEDEQIKWNGETNFRSLTEAIINLRKINNTDWAAAFGKTVQRFKISRLIAKDKCSSLLTIHLPKLQYLRIDYLKYDFEFLAKIIMKHPSITLRLNYLVKGYPHIRDVENFIEKYKYECNLDYDHADIYLNLLNY